MRTWLFLLVLLSLVASCAPTQFVRPLQKKEIAVNASFGGPLVNVPGIATIPVPFTTLGMGYGLSDKWTLHGALHPTAALFGNVQLSAGATNEFWRCNKWGASWQPGFQTIFDAYTKDFRFWPTLDANIYFTYQEGTRKESEKRKFVYLGFDNWFELNQKRTLGEQKQVFLLNGHLGHQMKRNQWAFHFELKFLVPYVANDFVVVDYKSLFGTHGATGIYFGLQYHLK